MTLERILQSMHARKIHVTANSERKLKRKREKANGTEAARKFTTQKRGNQFTLSVRDNWMRMRVKDRARERKSEGHCFVNEYHIILKGMQLIFMHYFCRESNRGQREHFQHAQFYEEKSFAFV